MKLIIKDVDITFSNQSMRICNYTDYSGGHADALRIVFNDTYDLWRKWELVKNDKIRVINNSLDTGDMYISEISIEDGAYKIKALSTPSRALNQSSSIRENIKLSGICSEISNELGFKLDTYETNDFLYSYVERINQNPISYLEALLIKEGYLQKIFNNRLIICSEKGMEQKPPKITVTKEDFVNEPSFNTTDAKLLASVENVYQSSKSVVRSKAVSGLSGKSLKLNLPVDSVGEGERYCKNIMRYHNKYEFTGSGMISESEITAGVTINLEGDYAGWAGNNFVYEVKHDMIFNRQAIKFRKPIAGDY